MEPTFIEKGLNAVVNARLDGVDGLIPSIMDCRCFKALCMAWLFVDFKHVSTSSFYNITHFPNLPHLMSLFLNSFDVSHNLSFKVSS
jgi:hypothetical protein